MEAFVKRFAIHVFMFVPKSILFKRSEAKKRLGIFCCAYHCRNKPAKKKGGLCHKHYHIHRRIIDPIYNRYANFKINALRRKKEFTITLEQFRTWCKENGYLEKGNRGFKCTIDRINNNEGYHIWNIQTKTMIANIKKYHESDKHLTNETESLTPEHEDYVPF